MLYVTVYRLSVLAIGALSIYLGFRLFSRLPGQADSAEIASSAGVQAGEFKLRVTNFLPGIYFALFGTVLIGIMLWQGPPQLKTEDVHEKTAFGEKTTSRAAVRRDDNIHLDGALRQERSDLRAESKVSLDQEWKMLDKPGMIEAEAAVPLANIAREWNKEGRIGEAVAMARLAYLYGPEIDKAAHLSLFAELLDANGNRQEAADARAELEQLRQKVEEE
ncbi:MAG: hypothetical protein D3917_19770 [Candidatus Electrothrix sp. AX5]|nr:hypothetical protein [Candidatus Electrothrix sp. AX5]